jgi:hypothetical protein
VLNLKDVEEIVSIESRNTTIKFVATVRAQNMAQNFQSRSEQHGIS